MPYAHPTTQQTDGVPVSPAGGELLQREMVPPVMRLGLEAEAATKEAGRARAGTRASR
jgi:hypothetical protein